MAISLYEVSVLNYQQTLGAVSGFLGRSLTHFREHNIDPGEIVETRLYPDMLPFRFQVQSVVHHSLGTIEALKSGVFRPPHDMPPDDYAALQASIEAARVALKDLSAAEINGREGAEVVFEFRDAKMLFSAEGFVQSFSLPNLHFHATTAYDILRSKGAPLGKRNYLGMLRLKT